jgi:carbamate kinase
MVPPIKALNKVTLNELKKYYNEGHFPPGEMGPKILAAIRFLEAGGKKSIISDVENGWEAFNGKTGTHVTK